MLLGVGLVAVAAAGVLGVQHLLRDRQYHTFLTTGDTAVRAGNLDAAVEAYGGAVTLRPDSMVAHLRRGEAYGAQRRDEAAMRDLREAVRLSPSTAQPIDALGDQYHAQHQPAQAAECYAQSVALDDSDPVVLYKLGLARYQSGSPASAVDPLRRAVAIRDSFAAAHYLLGVALRDTQNLDGAIAALEKATQASPALLAAHEELADIFRMRNRTADEMAQLNALAVLDPRGHREAALALAQARHGDFDVAVATLTMNAADATDDPDAQLALGRVYLLQAERRPDRSTIIKAIAAIQHALDASPRRSDGLALLGRARYLLADDDGAERILREATAALPADPDAFRYLADACERQSHFGDARDALAALDAIEGDTATPAVRATRLRRLGALSVQSGNTAAAVTYLQQAIERGGYDGPTLVALADAAWRTGQIALAQRTLVQATAFADPRNPELIRLKKVIR